VTAIGLRVGFVPGVTLTKWRRIWADRFRRIPLEVLEIAMADQRAALTEGRVDMCFVRLPIDKTDLHAIPLYEEVPVVVAAKDHPIALFAEVTWADLAGEHLIDPGDPTAIDRAVGGAGVLAVPQSVARQQSRRDLVYRPITDGTPTQIALAWMVEHPGELIEDFVGIVRGRTVNSSRSRAQPPAPTKPEGRRRRGR
jgi:DNA-binding transcriptional LysR family regulator